MKSKNTPVVNERTHIHIYIKGWVSAPETFCWYVMRHGLSTHPHHTVHTEHSPLDRIYFRHMEDFISQEFSETSNNYLFFLENCCLNMWTLEKVTLVGCVLWKSTYMCIKPTLFLTRLCVFSSYSDVQWCLLLWRGL